MGSQMGTLAQHALSTPRYATVVSGPDLGICLPVNSHLSIGREMGLTDRQVSRQHFALKNTAGKLWVKDLTSTNGTWLQGGRFLRPISCSTWQPWTRRCRLKTGRNWWKLRPRPHQLKFPRPPARSRRKLTLALPLVFSLALTATFRPLLAAVLLSALGLVSVLVWALKRGVLRPDVVLLSAAAKSCNPLPAAAEKSAQVCAWLKSGFFRGRPLALLETETCLFTGPGAVKTWQWYLAQVIASGTASVYLDGQLLGWGPHLVVASESGERPEIAPADKSVLEEKFQLAKAIYLGVSQNSLESWAQRVVVINRAKLPGSPWWQAICSLAHTADAKPELPTEVQLPESECGWKRGGKDLMVEVGMAADGPVTIDLVKDGPHALVAGTTGSGKSEFLITWILQLALTFSPEAVNFVLCDFKGGAAFGPLANLPHTVGVLTNLEVSKTTRALSSLQAELRRRQRLLAKLPAKDYENALRKNPQQVPPRLIVVVDEFRELAISHPKLLEQLVSIATLGRSLGVHLILATQKPTGIVDSQIKANTNLRVCLRVLEGADAADVIGTNAGANLPAIAGRGLLVSETTQLVQFYYCPNPQEVVEKTRRKFQKSLLNQPFRPWKDPLPEKLILPNEGGFLVGLADYPQQQSQQWLKWDPTDPVLVVGTSRSGKTTALKQLAKQLSRTMPVVFVGNAHDQTSLPGEGIPTVDIHDRRRGQRILKLAQAGKISALVVDDVESYLNTLQGQNWKTPEGWEQLVRLAPSLGMSLVVAASPNALHSRWGANITKRLILPLRDQVQCSALGLEASHCESAIAGRGWWHDEDGQTLVQVGIDTGSYPNIPAPVVELPHHCHLEDANYIGLGGDDGRPVARPSGSVLVVGGRHSGKTTALKRLCQGRQNEDLVVADDLDQQDAPFQTQVLHALQAGKTVLASCSVTALNRSFSGVLPQLFQSADVIALGGISLLKTLPECGEPDLLEDDLAAIPGRGIMRITGTWTNVQLSDFS